MKDVKMHTCCFFGHRKITETEKLKSELYNEIENLILNEKVYTFLFGSKSQFNDLCHRVVTELKEKYPHIQRIYVRAEFPYISEDYEKYLLKNCEKTYFPEKMINAGKAVYIERNFEMIENSRYCVCYYDKTYSPSRIKRSKKDLSYYQQKSGTKIAYDYAAGKKREIINLAEKM